MVVTVSDPVFSLISLNAHDDTKRFDRVVSHLVLFLPLASLLGRLSCVVIVVMMK